MADTYEIGWFGRDSSAEATSIQFYTAHQIDIDTPDAKVTAFLTALAAISEFDVNRTESKRVVRAQSDATAGDGSREDKILLTFTNADGDTYTGTIPCRRPRSALPTQERSDYYPLGSAPWSGPTGFKAAFEALVTGKLGEPVTLISAKLVGRNI